MSGASGDTGLFGDWRGVLGRLVALPGRVGEAMRQANRVNAEEAREEVVEAILGSRAGGKALAPLHPFTVSQRHGGGARPLFDRGDLVRAIAFEITAGGLGYHLSVKKGARAASGIPMVELLDLLQNGRIVRVTPRMRAALHARGLHLRADTVTLVIPPRPVLQPVLKQIKARQRERLAEAVKAAVRGG